MVLSVLLRNFSILWRRKKKKKKKKTTKKGIPVIIIGSFKYCLPLCKATSIDDSLRLRRTIQLQNTDLLPCCESIVLSDRPGEGRPKTTFVRERDRPFRR